MRWVRVILEFKPGLNVFGCLGFLELADVDLIHSKENSHQPGTFLTWIFLCFPPGKRRCLNFLAVSYIFSTTNPKKFKTKLFMTIFPIAWIRSRQLQWKKYWGITKILPHSHTHCHLCHRSILAILVCFQWLLIRQQFRSPLSVHWKTYMYDREMKLHYRRSSVRSPFTWLLML